MRRLRERGALLVPRAGWVAVAVAIATIALGALWIARTGTHPGYDAFGWMVWGHRLLHGGLNTDGAPSWKPLTFLFTLPYGLFGGLQLTLWTVTATAGALASSIFAARVAYRLARPRGSSIRSRWPALVGSAVAGVGVLGISGLSQQVLIATSDPLIVTLCLAAIDAHLSKRPRLAFALIVLASLGRPETWLFAVGYGVWAWRAVPSMRLVVVVGILLIPAGWFIIPGLSSRSWFVSGDLALNSPRAVHGDLFTGVLNRFLGLYELPMRVAVLVALGLAVAWRDRALLGLAGLAALWVGVEIAFAYHGWSATPRYIMEPAAVLIVTVGAAAGRILGADAAALARGGTVLVRCAGAAAFIALVVALAPVARQRARLLDAQVAQAKIASRRISRLRSVIAADGGPARILACGHPVTTGGNQSALAWSIGLNVGNVGYKPGREISAGRPIVFFKPYLNGWEVHPLHTPPGLARGCDRLRIQSALS